MLEVREEANGLWIDNGRKRVWISSKALDASEILYVNNGIGSGDLVHKIADPLIVGERYSGKTLNENVRDKMIVTNVAGNAYQYLAYFGGWCGFVSKDTRPELLDDCDYYLVWKGSQ